MDVFFKMRIHKDIRMINKHIMGCAGWGKSADLELCVFCKKLKDLPEIQKRRIIMYFFEGMTYEEIATIEECKHPAVVKSVKAALEKLKNILEE